MICVSIEAIDFEECESLMRKHSCFEFRLDRTIMSLDEIKEIFSMPNKMIATCRTGKFDDRKRKQILITAVKSGAMYVDVENDSDTEYITEIKQACKSSYCKLIISYHNFDETPSEEYLINTIDSGFDYGADIVKIACKVNSEEDNVKLLSLYRLYDKGKLIIAGLGDKGKITRIAASFLGSPITYASLERNLETSPGQIEVVNLKKIFDLMK